MSPFLHADWPAPPGVKAVVTLRHGAGQSRAPFDSFNLGNRSAADGDEPAIVDANRAELVERLALPAAPRWLRQVHGTRVLRFEREVEPPAAGPRGDPPRSDAPRGDSSRCDVPQSHAVGHDAPQLDARSAGLSRYPNLSSDTRSEIEPEPEADAAVTDAAGVVLAILTADCLPVLFASRDGSEVAAAHAGWRGLADGVLEATVASMRTSPDQLIAWLGPAAGPAHYEVGVDVYDAFVARHWADGAAFTTTRPHHWRVDLPALARRRLVSAGLLPTAIHASGLCTISDPARFFSHRRDRRSGRMASLVWIDERRR